MMKPKYHNYNSFLGKTRIILVLLAILPFLVVVYLFTYEEIRLTNMALIFSVMALFSILTGFSLLRRSSDQLVNLSRKTGNIALGETSEPIQIMADQELEEIAGHFNSMQKKLKEIDRVIREQSVQLMIYARDLSQSYNKVKKEEELRNRLSRYVGENLVKKLIDSKEGALLENERKEVTILFADIRSFSTIAERMSAEDVVFMLNNFFSAMVDIIFRNNGILDKFIGDKLMAVFGVISPDGSGSNNAVKAAIEMQDATKKLMKSREKQGKETFETGIGINTGYVIVGNVGSENRMDYTVIGDSVNVAARLEQMAGGGEIIIGEQTYRQIQDRFQIEKKGEIYVKNKIEPITCYKMLR